MGAMQRRQCGRVAVVLVVVLGPIAAFAIALWPVYVTPRADRPAPADATVVLGGAHDGREIARLAAAEHWRKVIVVTFTPHLSRARYIIGKCWDGDLLMVENAAYLAPAGWAYNFVYQSFGYARALFEDC